MFSLRAEVHFSIFINLTSHSDVERSEHTHSFLFIIIILKILEQNLYRFANKFSDELKVAAIGEKC